MHYQRRSRSLQFKTQCKGLEPIGFPLLLIHSAEHQTFILIDRHRRSGPSRTDVVELVDDLDGTASEDISTVNFSLDGASYEIDLKENNAERLRQSLARYVGAARRTGGRIKRAANTTGPATRPTADREQTKAIREWARDDG
jgi:hypothetical protein